MNIQEIKTSINEAFNCLLRSNMITDKKEALFLLQSGNAILDNIPSLVSHIRTKAYIFTYEQKLHGWYDEKMNLKSTGKEIEAISHYQRETLRKRISFYNHVLNDFLQKNDNTTEV